MLKRTLTIGLVNESSGPKLIKISLLDDEKEQGSITVFAYERTKTASIINLWLCGAGQAAIYDYIHTL